MPKKAKDKSIKMPVIILGCFLLSACAATKTANVHDYRAMECEQIMTELNTLHNKVEAAKNNKEIGRAVDTGASVAVQGASMAGIPYVGGVYSIGRTLMNYSKQTSVNSADIIQGNIFTLENVAYEKDCL